MRVRLPLYGKILAWFFVNLVVVAGVFVVLFNAQFHFNLDWFFFFGARERLEAVRNLIIADLETTLPDNWPQVLQRYNEAHHVEFAIFDDDAQPVVGSITEVPEQVRARILAPPNFPGARPPTAGGATPTPGPERCAPRPFNANRRWWPRHSLRAIMRSTSPTQSWLLATGWLDNPMAGDRMRIVLVARSNTI